MIQRVRSTTNVARLHRQALHIGSELTRWFRRERDPQVLKVTPERVIAALHRVGINCVLMGVHGINVYRDQPRATQDVDVLVTKKDVRKAVRVLEATFPYLEVQENAAAARFVNAATQNVVLDVMKPNSQAMQTVFRHTVPIGTTHRIPDLEMALISKFIAMLSTNRRMDKRQLDAGDFGNIVLHNRARIDLEKLKRLADKVYPRGGAKVLGMIADVDAGRQIIFENL